MKKIKSVLSFTLAMILLLSACGGAKPSESEEPNASDLPLTFDILDASYITLPFIGTRETEMLYDGTVLTTGNSAESANGHRFVLVNAEFSFAPDKALLDAIILKIGDTEYAPHELSEALSDYGYAAPETAESGSYTMNLLFEVTNQDAKLSDDSWFLKSGEISFSLADKYYQKIPVEGELLQAQYETELSIMNTYLNGHYTLQSPYVVLNPYGTAPLAALILFDTESPARVSYCIEGKTDDGDIVSADGSFRTNHELPIVGLYAGYKNTVSISLEYEDGRTEESSVSIETAAHKIDAAVTASTQSAVDNDALIYVIDAERTVFDYFGDVRWYTTIDKMAPSSATELLPNGHFLISPYTYEAGCQLMEMDFMGKIYWVLENGAGFHHDAALDPYGNIVALNFGLTTIAPHTPITLKNLDFTDIFSFRESLEPRTAGTSDWLHPNSIEFTDEDSVMLSFRNQHMVMKLNYNTSEPEWILSPAIDYHPELADKFLTPIGDDFEWFYSQHCAIMLEDMDNNPNTMDILLFDNGDARAFTEADALPENERYSRVVQYRIDEVKGTVEQISDFGKELGNEYYASMHSGAQYLYEDKAVLAAIDSNNTKRVVQYSLNGEIEWELDLSSTIYRAYKDSKSLLTQGVSPLLSTKGILTVLENLPNAADSIPKAAPFQYRVNEIKVTGDYMTFSGWGYPTDSKISNSSNAYLYLTNEEGTYAFKLTKTRRTFLWNAADFKGVLDANGKAPVEPFGYYDPYLDISSIPAGTYDIYLAMETEDGFQSALLPHKLERAAVTSIHTISSLVRDIDKQLEANVGKYTLDEPSVILNPYSLTPLAALAQFDTEAKARISVTVAGKDKDADFTSEYEEFETSHFVPIYGLYADYENSVTIKAIYEDGKEESKTVTIKTAPLPAYMPEFSVITADTAKMADGLTFLSGSVFGLTAIDHNGDVRWYTDLASSFCVMGTPLKVLENGHLAVLGGEILMSYYANMVYEIDMLGKIHMSWLVPDNTAHHDIVELPNGNLMVLAGNLREGTLEDTIMELDRETGRVVQNIDFKDILKLKDFIAEPAYINVGAQNAELTAEEQLARAEAAGRHDWLHLNAMMYDETRNTITVSSRNLNAIITIDRDTHKIIWIFADPESRFVKENPHIQDVLLKSIDPDIIYAYGQHSSRITEDGDLLLFDNRYNDSAGELNPDESEHYSRIALFDIDWDNLTVSQTWDFGKELGNESYSGYISSVEKLGDDHYIADFGGIVFLPGDGMRTHNLGLALGTGGGTEARIYEIKDGEIVFELHAQNNAFNNVYRAHRMELK